MVMLVGFFKHDLATDDVIAKLFQLLDPFPHLSLQCW
jgi:hypothetical protein